MPQVCRLRDQQIVATDSLKSGDEILIQIGELFPVDCTISEGASDIDIASINGEFTPLAITVDDLVKAGSLNISAPVYAKVSQQAGNHNINQIQQLIDRASSEKSHTAQIADRIARHFVTAVLLLASAGFISWWFIE